MTDAAISTSTRNEKVSAFAPWFREDDDLRRALDNLASALGDVALGGVVDCRTMAQQYDFAKSLVIDAFIVRLVAHNAVQRDAGGCEVYTVRG